MVANKTTRFAFDWWIIEKRFVYLMIAIFLACGCAAGAALYVWKYGNPFKNVAEMKYPSGARFISFEGDVRVIRAATRETLPANTDTQLYPGDTVQTQTNGRARIGLADGSTLVVKPNSTIIIRDNARADDGKRTNIHVQVDSGQLSVRTEQQAAGTTNVVETPKTKSTVGESTIIIRDNARADDGKRTNIHVQVDSGQLSVRTEQQAAGTTNVVETPKTKSTVGESTNASFGVNPEGTEEIRVSTGAVETTNSSGEKTSIRGGEYVSVNNSGRLSTAQRLLDVPQPAQPHDLEKVFVGANGAASVALKWLRPQSGTPAYYRVEVATSPFFVADGKVIERDQLVATEFGASELRPGVYFWRVRATASSGQASDWSDPLKFIVATRGTGSQVAVSNLSAELLGGSLYLVRGRAEPGTTIKVSGRETIVAPDGSFQIQVTASGGVRDVTLEAQDPQGNSSQYKVSLSGRTARGRT